MTHNLSLRKSVSLGFAILLASFALFANVARAADPDGTKDHDADSVTSPLRNNSGYSTNSDVVTKNSDGSIAQYGNSAIMYQSPSTATGKSTQYLMNLGEALYAQNCSSCHGAKADGVLPSGSAGDYPSLVGIGPATIDFWITTGRMPAANSTEVQANRKPARLTRTEALAIAAWIDSLSPAEPLVPKVDLTKANVANGLSLYALNCAACHTITGGGNALASGTYAPSLHLATAPQIVEAIRTGPGNMPNFSGALTDDQVRDIVKYVTTDIQHPQNPGGLGLGGLGPVAEGFIGLALGMGILMLAAFWVGDRQ